jgi:LPS-assembly protein
LGLNYVKSVTYATPTTPPQVSEAIMLQLGLRTIGTASISENVP